MRLFKPLGSYNWIFFRQDDDFDEALRDLIDALDTDLDWVRAHTRLLTRAIEWDRSGRDNSFVLRGSDLRTAEEWQVRAADKEPKLTALQTEYVLASRRAATRRQRITLGAVTFGLVVAVVLGLAALWQWKEAERQADIALGRQVAAQAELMRNQQPRLLPQSVLLAIEAVRLLHSSLEEEHPSLEAEQAIRAGLARLPRSVARLAHEDSVNAFENAALAFSPDGKRLATASSDGTARVWDLASSEEVARIEHEGGSAISAVAFSPDGRYAASAGGPPDNTARVWEATSGEEVARMEHEHGVEVLAFSPDGTYLATTSWATTSSDGTVRVWEATSGELVTRMEHEGVVPVRDVVFSPDGKYVASASEDDTARAWEVSTSEEVARMDHENVVNTVVFSPDGRYLATASEDDTARVWEVSSGEEVARMEHENIVRDITFSPDGRYLATASNDRTAQVWFLRSEDLIEEACSRLGCNLTREEWQLYLPGEPYHKTCPNVSEAG